MRRFNQTRYHKAQGVAEIGVGNTWSQVYRTLVPLGVNVLGGRVAGELTRLIDPVFNMIDDCYYSGVGTAGLTLGGGMFPGRSNPHFPQLI